MNNVTFLSLSAADAVAGMLAEVEASSPVALDLLNRWTQLIVNAPAATVTLVSQALSTDGLVGQYTGNVTLPYTKRSLNTLLPYPFVFGLNYPTTMVLLQTYMLSNYGILIEDGEFSVDGNTQTGELGGTDAIDAPVNAITGYVTLRALPTSGRFVAGSTINLLLTSTNVQVPLNKLLALGTGLDLHLLTDHF